MDEAREDRIRQLRVELAELSVLEQRLIAEIMRLERQDAHGRPRLALVATPAPAQS